ncbi:aromatic hydrocarbon degradation protein [Lamprobacter modestohalophilus]|uniref:Aromatic hydrocarbon degradation protein n=1 Tax=Lamprobacter modestohalophilus TaxID=1064514 RepID=A0A9X1B246_9GAMM|nr:porin [Lamprobacter modestohalophilus]MBK1616875.1 aromatic hydrocarbon degradation protein [Lamprobacter modestohalophilus]MCF7979539.1 porin [Chromatiaceae bacterium]MCF7996252.1 porin [Chromatiaceae bacterium]MCF8004417.1 porin [Chromatiaceae bacterium]
MYVFHNGHLSALAISGAILGGCLSSSATASGFAVPELSTAGIATANALVANPVERGAVPYNPAAIAFHDQSWLSAGSLLIGPTFSVDNASGSHDSAGADWLVAPMIQAAIRINERWSAGLSVNAPFGLETRWKTETFPPLTGSIQLPPPPLGPGGSVPASPQPTQSNLEIIDFTPTVTYAISDELAVALGADIYWAKSATLNSSITQLEGDGIGLGFNLSALYAKGPFSAGINFHSSSTIKVDGSYSALNPTMVLIGALQPSQTAELDLDLPWRLQLGARYELTPALAVEFDWTRTGWSSFEEIQVKGDLNGATLFADVNDWDDANAYRLGMTYQLQEQTQLRFGYSFDETPQGDAHFSARVPDNDRHLFGIGVGHSLGDGWQLEAGYMYVMFLDRNYRSAKPYLGGSDINGTDAINGDYEANAHLIGLEVSKSFDAF